MWTRKELKEKAKKSLSVNYWKTVLVSLILAFILGSTGSSIAGKSLTEKKDTDNTVNTEYQTENVTDNNSMNFPFRTTEDGKLEFSDGNSSYELSNSPESIPGRIEHVSNMIESGKFGTGMIIVLILVLVTVVLVLIGTAIAIDILILNPMEVGCKRFFTRNLNQKANVSEVAYAFDNNYKTVVKTVFFRDLYTALWSLLLIIPGIVKMYEYRMIPYILADHPELTSKEVFAKSKEMMKGQKWHAFVLDLSFIGWGILSLFTLGLLGTFYVTPYRNMTNAALYEKLEYGRLAIEEN
ncbi:DUF975 family protein [Butyrivibrio fibrisolvens]|uniref:DUF975 family protein n=1 Tax=Butyrivibrio fibrisolvens TaxID=831 RepID=UPI000405599F|nr:DUF975 family protein [Butyrivibrio fibrisolvens]